MLQLYAFNNMTKNKYENQRQSEGAEGSESGNTRLLTLQERYVSHISSINHSAMSAIPFDLSVVYPETIDIEELKSQVEDLKKCLDSLRPIPDGQLANLQEALDTKYTYDSNRIEGNTLTHQETAMVTLHGVTVSGKPLKDHLEAINHRDAITYIRDIATRNVPLTERTVFDIHSIILSGIDRDNAGRYRREVVRVAGSDFVFPNPLKVPELMGDLFGYYDGAKDTEHPVVFAANMHAKLVNIHPFIDGNGRTARLVMNLILLGHGYIVANISGDKSQRGAYYAALEASHADESMSDFIRFILTSEKKSLVEYIGLLSPEIEKGRGGYYLERIAPYLGE